MWTHIFSPAGVDLEWMMAEPQLPWLTTTLCFCSSATLAPSSAAQPAAGTPAAPAPTTTMSKSMVSSGVMSPSSTTEDSTSSVVRPSGTTVSALLEVVGAVATPLAWLMQFSAAFLMASEVMVAPEWPSTSLDWALRIFSIISSPMSAP